LIIFIHGLNKGFYFFDVGTGIFFVVPAVAVCEPYYTFAAIRSGAIECSVYLVDHWQSVFYIQQDLIFTDTTVIWNLEQDAFVDRVIRYLFNDIDVAAGRGGDFQCLQQMRYIFSSKDVFDDVDVNGIFL
jgi:hypothetical protein